MFTLLLLEHGTLFLNQLGALGSRTERLPCSDGLYYLPFKAGCMKSYKNIAVFSCAIT